MITNALILIASAFLYMVSAIFSAFSFEVPEYISEAMVDAFTMFQRMREFFPVDDVLLALLFLLGVYWRVYVFKIILWGWSFVPYFGSRNDLPVHTNTTDLRSNAPSGTVDLRQGKLKPGKIYRSMDGIIKR